ncbi:MAG: hypothetical protein F6K42_37055, partial [Leptolyngbya sp. SIO1D8]|nr:hypothetical protein [Leptolyngbya sp. SIO1D8]
MNLIKNSKKIAKVGLASAVTGLAGVAVSSNPAIASSLAPQLPKSILEVSGASLGSDYSALAEMTTAPRIEGSIEKSLHFSSQVRISPMPNVTTAQLTAATVGLLQFSSDRPEAVDMEGIRTTSLWELDEIAQVPEPSVPSFSSEEASAITSMDGEAESEASISNELTESDDTVPLAQPQVLNASQVQILSPSVGAILDVPAATVILQYPSGIGVDLWVNGERVDPGLVGRTAVDPTTSLVTQTWYGVPLSAGGNTLVVTPTGSQDTLATVEIQVRGTPVELTVGTRGDRVSADGRSTITVQGQLLDESGNISNWDTVVTLTASDGTFIGADFEPDTPGFQVEAINGRYVAELQSSLEAQVVQLEAKASGMTAYNQVQFSTQQRP